MGATWPVKFLVLMLTTRCNLACAYCYAKAGPGGRDMTPETAREALQRFRSPEGPLTVELAGGEPLLAFDLVREIIGQSPPRPGALRYALQTNGLLLDGAKLDFLIEQGVGLGLSMDGVPAVNDQVRGGSAAVLRALDLLDRRGMGVNLTVVLTRRNLDALPEFLLFCAGHSCVRVINLDLLRPLGRARGAGLEPEAGRIRRMVPRMLQALGFINARRFPPLNIREVDQFRRRAGLKEIGPYCYADQGLAAAVTPDGEVYPCASLAGHREYKAGDVWRLRPEGLAKLAGGGRSPQECRECPARPVCRGGCPSRQAAYAGAGEEFGKLECVLRRTLHERLSA